MRRDRGRSLTCRPSLLPLHAGGSVEGGAGPTDEGKNVTIAELYTAAVEADEKFHAELIRAYGESEAGVARYLYTHADAGVQQAASLHLAACAALNAAFEALRAAS